MVEEITAMDVDFAKWYTDICKKAELVSYTSVKGCMVIRPYGYAIWENIQRILDGMFKATGHVNVNMPMFIPESLLQKEKDHVEGFAPEVAWVTHGGSEKLEERLCVRPTSETLFCEHYADIVHSYRDLPKLYNQWVSVVRWEKTTRPFLRSREFLWQEGHTIHATAEEAIEETERMLDVYADFCKDALAIPVVKGQKTESDKFAGAVSTYCIEALMHDGKALQAGTSHYFGDGFAKAFGIEYTDKENQRRTPHQTSWGMTTRLIGAIIMTHGDDSGLVLPPAVAPVQVVVVPVAMHKAGVLEKAQEVADQLKAAGLDPVQIALNGAEALLIMVFKEGFFHADPHAGNLFILPGNRVAFIDFGMVGALRPREMDFLANLSIGFARRDPIGLADSMIRLCDQRFFDQRDDLIFSLQQMIKRFSQLPIEKFNYAKMIQDCIDLITKYGLCLPTGIFMLAKALATIQKVAERLDPDIPFAKLIIPYAKEVVMTQFSPRKMAASLFQTLKGYATLLQTAPGDISEILYKLKQGEIKHELQITDVPEFRKMLRNGASRLAYAILLVGLFIGAIGILDKRPDLKYGHFLLFVSSFLIFIVMLKWILRKKRD